METTSGWQHVGWVDASKMQPGQQDRVWIRGAAHNMFWDGIAKKIRVSRRLAGSIHARRAALPPRAPCGNLRRAGPAAILHAFRAGKGGRLPDRRHNRRKQRGRVCAASSARDNHRRDGRGVSEGK
jgi:hypothetical protein